MARCRPLQTFQRSLGRSSKIMSAIGEVRPLTESLGKGAVWPIAVIRDQGDARSASVECRRELWQSEDIVHRASR